MSRIEAASTINSSYVQDEEENPNKKSVLFATMKSTSVSDSVPDGASDEKVEARSQRKLAEGRSQTAGILCRLRETWEAPDKIDDEYSDDELPDDDSIKQEAIELEIEREATEREVEELLYEKDNTMRNSSKAEGNGRKDEDEKEFQIVFGSVDPLCRGNFFDEALKAKTPEWCRGNHLKEALNTKTPEWAHVMEDPVVNLEAIFAKVGFLPKTKGIRREICIDKKGNKVEKLGRIAQYEERDKGSPFRKSSSTMKKEISQDNENNAAPPPASSTATTKGTATEPQAKIANVKGPAKVLGGVHYKWVEKGDALMHWPYICIHQEGMIDFAQVPSYNGKDEYCRACFNTMKREPHQYCKRGRDGLHTKPEWTSVGWLTEEEAKWYM